MSIEKYTRFITCLTAKIPIPPDLVAWQLEAYDRHKTEGTPLCICLGIRGAGIRSAKTRELIKRRDNYLLWALNNCASYPGQSTWNQCVILADQIKRYPRSKNENPILPILFALECKLPQSTPGIFERITKLRESPPYSASTKTGIIKSLSQRWLMDSSGKTILKHSLSYLEKHDSVSHADALKIVAKVIQTGDTLNNPLFEHLLDSGLPADPEQLDKLLRPGGDQ